MRFDKLTTKFQQAIAEAQSLANLANHTQIEPAHVLKAMISSSNNDDIQDYLRLSGMKNTAFDAIEQLITNFPQSQSNDNEPAISRQLNSLFNWVEKKAFELKDDYISADLFLLSLMLIISFYDNYIVNCNYIIQRVIPFYPVSRVFIVSYCISF